MSNPRQKISDTLIIPPSCRERFIPLGDGLQRHGVQLAGISQLAAPYEVGRSCPPFHLLFYTVSGRGQLATAQVQAVLQPGQLLIVPAGVAHAYWADGGWEGCWVHLEDTDAWASLRGSEAQLLPARELAQVHRVMEGLIAESLASLPAGNHAIDLYTELLLLYLQRECAATAADDRRLRPIWEEVHANLAYPWSIEELAARAACSPAHFFRLTRQLHQLTPMQMVTAFRLSRAKELLRFTDYTLDQIAAMVGYANPYAFSRAFRRSTGISPGAYRRSSGTVAQPLTHLPS